jgi:hypothetical protein
VPPPAHGRTRYSANDTSDYRARIPTGLIRQCMGIIGRWARVISGTMIKIHIVTIANYIYIIYVFYNNLNIHISTVHFFGDSIIDNINYSSILGET